MSAKCQFHTIGFACGCDRCETRMIDRSEQHRARATARASVLMRTKPVSR